MKDAGDVTVLVDGVYSKATAVITSMFASTSLLFILAILIISAIPSGTNPLPANAPALDAPLRHAFVAFALALPVLFFSALVRSVGRSPVVAYLLSAIAALIVEFGVFLALLHLDSAAAWGFALVAGVGSFLFQLEMSFHLAQLRQR